MKRRELNMEHWGAPYDISNKSLKEEPGLVF